MEKQTTQSHRNYNTKFSAHLRRQFLRCGIKSLSEGSECYAVIETLRNISRKLTPREDFI